MQNFGKGGKSNGAFGGQMGKMFETMMQGGMGGMAGGMDEEQMNIQDASQSSLRQRLNRIAIPLSQIILGRDARGRALHWMGISQGCV